MLLLLLLSATTVLALASNPDDDTNLEDQNLELPNFYQGLDKGFDLCQDNAQNTKFIKENIERIAQDAKANSKRAEVNIEQVLQNDNVNFKRSQADRNANAKRSEINIQQVIENANAHANRSEISNQLIIQNANDNAKRIEESLNENTRVLKQILQALGRMGAVRKGTSCSATVGTITAKSEKLATTAMIPPTLKLTTTPMIPPTPRLTSTPTQQTTTVKIQVQGQDCAELYTNGERADGTYLITLADNQEGFQVYCDMETDGGGWTVFQRRGDFGFPEDYFYRNWTEYKNGFGELDKEFWLGNDRISALSKLGHYELRVDLMDMEGEHSYTKYSYFRIENESLLYTLRIGENYTGHAGDSLYDPHRDEPFSTMDRNNDVEQANCAVARQGAWWYYKCGNSNLNGLNLRGPDDTQRGIHWAAWQGHLYSLAFTEMMMRPANFSTKDV